VAAGAIGVRETILLGGAVSVLAAGVVFVPGVRHPEKN
jgi:hypothetical protein